MPLRSISRTYCFQTETARHSREDHTKRSADQRFYRADHTTVEKLDKDLALCHARKTQILAVDEFAFNLCQLHEMIRCTKLGKIISKISIISISDQISTSIN